MRSNLMSGTSAARVWLAIAGFAAGFVAEVASRPASDGGDSAAAAGPILSENFDEAPPGDTRGWTGFARGAAHVGQHDPSPGLCMATGGEGDNLAAWASPTGWGELVDMRLYTIRIDWGLSEPTRQFAPVNLIYHNYYGPSAPGNTYGGCMAHMPLDDGSFAEPVTDGTWTYLMTPNCALLEQWRGLVDPQNSAFHPSADGFNDWAVWLALVDPEAGFVPGFDRAGTLCLKRIRVDASDLSELRPWSMVWGPPIRSDAFAAHAPDEPAQGAIDDMRRTAIYELDPRAGAVVQSLTPSDASAPKDEAGRYPLQFSSGDPDETLVQVAEIWTPPADSEETVPADLVVQIFETPRKEMVVLHASTRGGAFNMQGAATPGSGFLPDTTGLFPAPRPQPYIALATPGIPRAGATPRWRPLVQLVRDPVVGYADPRPSVHEIHDLRVYRPNAFGGTTR